MKPKDISRKLLHLLKCRDGNALVELGLIAPVMLGLIVGAVDYGRFAVEQATISSAARAGAQYGIQDQVYATNIDGMRDAAQEDAEDTALNVTPLNYCECPEAVGTAVDCGLGICADGTWAPMYVEVTAQRTFDFIFDYPGVPQSQNVVYTSKMRVR
jgi:Flp pilus assembly protein TadG